MNRQFFGDTRDLFKYDLLRHIMKALPLFDSITFVPMLTEAETTRKKGRALDFERAIKLGKAGSQNKDLITHMERLQDTDDELEYLQTVKAYFKKEYILAEILHTHQFSHEKRAQYFDNIVARLPKKTLVFLDPDIGLEESKPTKKHLLFDEVMTLYERMDAKSVLMIYQHFSREKHEEYIQRRCEELHALNGISPITITDNEIVFFFLAKNPVIHESLEDILSLYASTYPALSSGTCR